MAYGAGNVFGYKQVAPGKYEPTSGNIYGFKEVAPGKYEPTSGERYNLFGRNTGGNQPHDLGAEYLGKYNAFSNPTVGQAEGGKAQGFFANPTGAQGGFQKLTSSMMDNPAVYKAVRDRYIQFGSDPEWLGQLNTASEGAQKKFAGSSFTLKPEVLSKMWKPTGAKK